MDDIVKAVRDMAAQYERFQDNTGTNTKFKTFFPDPDVDYRQAVKRHYPKFEVGESGEDYKQGQFPAGIGQALESYNLDIFLYSYTPGSPKSSEEFCRKAVKNTQALFTRYNSGYPSGLWYEAELARAEYLLVRVTREHWGLTARVPVTIRRIANIDDIRGC